VYDKEAAAWQPGQGSPVSLLSLQADVNLAFKVIQEIGTSPAVSNVLKTVQDVINTVVSLVASSAGKAPQPVVVAVDDPCAREYPHVAMLCRAYRSITQR
jgi:hypothetical protein